MKYKMLLSYDGTQYVGWQLQPLSQGLSIQEVVERAFQKIFQEKIQLVGASRTDAGVHALGQVAHFETEHEFICKRLVSRLNSLLPHDIRVRVISPVDSTFHAQYSAIKKLYRYHVFLEEEGDPFSFNHHHHFLYPLSLPLLEEAAKMFVGTHDFTSFANRGGSSKTFERTIYRFDLIKENEGLVFECEGDGFLYKMIRNMIGTILEVGQGRLTLEDVKEIFQQKDRRKAPPPAPAKGLFLIKIDYPN